MVKMVHLSFLNHPSVHMGKTLSQQKDKLINTMFKKFVY